MDKNENHQSAEKKEHHENTDEKQEHQQQHQEQFEEGTSTKSLKEELLELENEAGQLQYEDDQIEELAEKCSEEVQDESNTDIDRLDVQENNQLLRTSQQQNKVEETAAVEIQASVIADGEAQAETKLPITEQTENNQEETQSVDQSQTSQKAQERSSLSDNNNLGQSAAAEEPSQVFAAEEKEEEQYLNEGGEESEQQEDEVQLQSEVTSRSQHEDLTFSQQKEKQRILCLDLEGRPRVNLVGIPYVDLEESLQKEESEEVKGMDQDIIDLLLKSQKGETRERVNGEDEGEKESFEVVETGFELKESHIHVETEDHSLSIVEDAQETQIQVDEAVAVGSEDIHQTIEETHEKEEVLEKEQQTVVADQEESLESTEKDQGVREAQVSSAVEIVAETLNDDEEVKAYEVIVIHKESRSEEVYATELVVYKDEEEPASTQVEDGESVEQSLARQGEDFKLQLSSEKQEELRDSSRKQMEINAITTVTVEEKCLSYKEGVTAERTAPCNAQPAISIITSVAFECPTEEYQGENPEEEGEEEKEERQTQIDGSNINASTHRQVSADTHGVQLEVIDDKQLLDVEKKEEQQHVVEKGAALKKQEQIEDQLNLSAGSDGEEEEDEDDEDEEDDDALGESSHDYVDGSDNIHTTTLLLSELRSREAYLSKMEKQFEKIGACLAEKEVELDEKLAVAQVSIDRASELDDKEYYILQREASLQKQTKTLEEKEIYIQLRESILQEEEEAQQQKQQTVKDSAEGEESANLMLTQMRMDELAAGQLFAQTRQLEAEAELAISRLNETKNREDNEMLRKDILDLTRSNQNSLEQLNNLKLTTPNGSKDRSEIDQLKQQLNEVYETLDKYVQTDKDRVKHIDEMAGKLAGTEEAIALNQGRVKQLEMQVKSLTESKLRSEIELLQAEEEIKLIQVQSNSERQRLTAEVSGLKDRLLREGETDSVQKKQSNTGSSSNGGLYESAFGQSQEHSNYEAIVADLRDTITVLNAQRDDQEVQLESYKKQNQQLVSSLMEIRSSIGEKQSMEEELESWQIKAKQLQRRVEESERSREQEAKQHSARYRIEVESLIQANEAMAIDSAEQKKTIEELSAVVFEMRGIIEQVDSDKQAAIWEANSERTRAEELEDAIAAQKIQAEERVNHAKTVQQIEIEQLHRILQEQKEFMTEDSTLRSLDQIKINQLQDELSRQSEIFSRLQNEQSELNEKKSKDIESILLDRKALEQELQMKVQQLEEVRISNERNQSIAVSRVRDMLTGEMERQKQDSWRLQEQKEAEIEALAAEVELAKQESHQRLLEVEQLKIVLNEVQQKQHINSVQTQQEFASRLAVAQREVEKTKLDSSEAEHARKELQIKVEKQALTIGELEAMVDSHSQTVHEATAKRAQEVRHLQELLGQSEEECEKMKSIFQQHLDSQTASLHAVSLNERQLDAWNRELQNKNEELIAENRELKAILEESIAGTDEVKEENVRLLEYRHTLEDSLQESMQIEKKLREEVSRLQKEIDEQSQTLWRVSEEREQMINEINRTTSDKSGECLELKEEISELQERLRNAEHCKKGKKSVCEEMREDLEKNEEINIQITKENAALEREIERTLNEKTAALEKLQIQSEQRSNSYAADIEQVTRRVKLIETENEELKTGFRDILAKHKDLERLYRQEKDNSNRVEQDYSLLSHQLSQKEQTDSHTEALQEMLVTKNQQVDDQNEVIRKLNHDLIVQKTAQFEPNAETTAQMESQIQLQRKEIDELRSILRSSQDSQRDERNHNEVPHFQLISKGTVGSRMIEKLPPRTMVGLRSSSQHLAAAPSPVTRRSDISEEGTKRSVYLRGSPGSAASVTNSGFNQGGDLDQAYLKCIQRSRNLLSKNETILHSLRASNTSVERGTLRPLGSSITAQPVLSNNTRSSSSSLRLQQESSRIGGSNNGIYTSQLPFVPANLDRPETLINQPSTSLISTVQKRPPVTDSRNRTYQNEQSQGGISGYLNSNNVAELTTSVAAASYSSSSSSYRLRIASNSSNQQQMGDCRYEGERLGNLRHGRGRCYYPNGEVYEGDWKSDKRHGYGILRDGNDEIYIGDWEFDQYHGPGCLRNKYAEQISQEFDYKNFDGLRNYWTSFSGEFKNNTLNGFGTLCLSNGEKFLGSFGSGKVHGDGTYYRLNGDLEIGFWQNNKFIGRS